MPTASTLPPQFSLQAHPHAVQISYTRVKLQSFIPSIFKLLNNPLPLHIILSFPWIPSRGNFKYTIKQMMSMFWTLLLHLWLYVGVVICSSLLCVLFFACELLPLMWKWKENKNISCIVKAGLYVTQIQPIMQPFIKVFTFSSFSLYCFVGIFLCGLVLLLLFCHVQFEAGRDLFLVQSILVWTVMLKYAPYSIMYLFACFTRRGIWNSMPRLLPC